MRFLTLTCVLLTSNLFRWLHMTWTTFPLTLRFLQLGRRTNIQTHRQTTDSTMRNAASWNDGRIIMRLTTYCRLLNILHVEHTLDLYIQVQVFRVRPVL